jgi:hypothetical protein
VIGDGKEYIGRERTGNKLCRGLKTRSPKKGEWRVLHIVVRLADGGDFDNVAAGKPDCFKDVGR